MANLGSMWEELLGSEDWGESALQLRIDADFLPLFDTLLLRATAPEVKALTRLVSYLCLEACMQDQHRVLQGRTKHLCNVVGRPL